MLHVTKPDGRKPRRRVLIVNPPIEEPYRARLAHAGDANGDAPATEAVYHGRQYTYPLPIGLLRIAGQLRREGDEVYFLDCFSSLPQAYPSSRDRQTPADGPGFRLTDNWHVRYHHLGLRYEEADKLLRHVSADEVLVGCTFTYHNEPAHRMIEIVKRRLPRVPLRFGGIYPTLAPDVARRSQADEVSAGPYPGIEDESLSYDFLGASPGFILIKGTSGCPNRCAYCAVHMLEGRRFRHRDPEEVFDEIRRAHQRYGLTQVGMWDSNILMQYDQYFGVVLRRIIDSNLELHLAAPEGFDYRLLTPQVARDMKAAGFKTVALALENVDTAYTREQLNRSNSIRKLKQAVAALNDAGFDGPCIRLFVIVGLPGQTIENVLDNIRFVWSLGCNVTLFPFTPIPGTQLYAEHLQDLHDLPLRALHPSLYSCVGDARTKDLLIDLTALGPLNRARQSQREHFREVLTSPDLLTALS